MQLFFTQGYRGVGYSMSAKDALQELEIQIGSRRGSQFRSHNLVHRALQLYGRTKVIFNISEHPPSTHMSTHDCNNSLRAVNLPHAIHRCIQNNTVGRKLPRHTNDTQLCVKRQLCRGVTAGGCQEITKVSLALGWQARF